MIAISVINCRNQNCWNTWFPVQCFHHVSLIACLLATLCGAVLTMINKSNFVFLIPRSLKSKIGRKLMWAEVALGSESMLTAVEFPSSYTITEFLKIGNRVKFSGKVVRNAYIKRSTAHKKVTRTYDSFIRDGSFQAIMREFSMWLVDYRRCSLQEVPPLRAKNYLDCTLTSPANEILISARTVQDELSLKQEKAKLE